jgi:hypothetical protein
METQQDTLAEETPTPGVGTQQSKLAIRIRDDYQLLKDSYLFNKKNRHISAPVLARAILIHEGFDLAIKSMIGCLHDHNDREDFARSILEAMDA